MAGLAWYEKMSGAGRSKQIVPSDQLLQELQRLDCRFRQRGSHITFHHDDSDTRGTIVYGTRKLWSQRTVAAAREKILGQAAHDAAQGQKQAAMRPFAAAGTALCVTVPGTLESEALCEDPTQIVLRDRAHPQIGTVVTVYDHPDIVTAAFAEIARKARNFGTTLRFLQDEGDFQVREKDGLLLIQQPVLDIEAVLEPYDPNETSEAGSVLDECFARMSSFDHNREILEAVIKSRKLHLKKEEKLEDGAISRTYVSRKFQRDYGIQLSIVTTPHGYVDDRQLVEFMDDADQNFFGAISFLMKHSYGFEVTAKRRDPIIDVKHPLIGGLDFTFPNFDNLPKLRDVYAKREELGEEEYIKQINRILELRDDILELVSYGLIFGVEQMTASSNTLFDTIETINKFADMDFDDPEEEDSGPAAADKARMEKRLKKKFKKMTGTRKGDGVEFDRNSIKDNHSLSGVRQTSLPETFPYGVKLTMPLRNPLTGEVMSEFPYMVLKGPKGENMMLFAQDGLNIFTDALLKMREKMGNMGDNLPADPEMLAARKKRGAALDAMTPQTPRA